MKALGFILISLFALPGFAGVGGYFSTTCVSASGRTVLTVLESDFSDPMLTLIIDGVPAVYGKSQSGTVVESHEMGFAGFKENGKKAVDVALIGNGQKRKVEVNQDPRIGSPAQVTSKETKQIISVDCKSFEWGP